MRRWGWIFAALLLSLNPAQAGKVKVWHSNNASHYERAEFTKCVVSSEGAIRLARHVKPIPIRVGGEVVIPDHVWDVVETSQGTLFLAADNVVYRMTSAGKADVALKCPTGQVFSLCLGEKGSVYAGTGPDGAIWKISADGPPSKIASNLGSYVWAMTCNPSNGEVYAATGPGGMIYHISAAGEVNAFYQTKQEHVLCLALAEDGVLYAGTDRNGLVYKIQPNGKGEVIFQANQTEIRRLVVLGDSVYACTSAPGTRRISPSKPNVSPLNLSSTLKPSDNIRLASNTSDISGPKDKEKEKDKDKPTAASAAPPPGNGENSVYRLASDGSFREVFRDKALLLGMCVLKDKSGSKLLLGTAPEGRLIEIEEKSGERCEVSRLEHGQIHALWPTSDGKVLLATGDLGGVFVLDPKYVGKGKVVSEVFDAKLVSRWGTAAWRADVPAGASVTVAFRGGNVAEPDSTWTPWTAELRDPADAAIGLPACRFVQYRVTLSCSDHTLTPSLKSVSLRYASINHTPQLKSLDVPDLDATSLKEPKKLKLKWSATDADEDELVYDLYMQKDGWKDWVLLEEGLTKSEYEWDTSAVPQGIYRVKVVASDRPENSPDDAQSSERISEPVPVANTGPNVSLRVVRVEKGKAILEGRAASPLVRIAAASYAVDGKKWQTVYTQDGLFDSKTESFRWTIDLPSSGSHVVVLRVKDAAGNFGSADVLLSNKSE